MRRGILAIATLAVGASVLAAGGLAIQRGPATKNGGTFRISFLAVDFDSTDPAIAYATASWALLNTTCANLFNYPDKPPPRGLQAQPEVAAGYPHVSHDGKTFTFTLRTGFHFSNGAPLTATAFARAINRVLTPAMRSPGAQYVKDIVGADDVLAGKAASARGISVHGNRLVIRFERAVPDFPARTAMPFFCAVPPTLPADPEGVGAYAGAGPYYVAEYVPGRRVVLKRNRFYHGSRPRRIASFVVDFTQSTYEDLLDSIGRGQTDWGWAPSVIYLDPERQLARKYGLNKSQFWVRPGLTLGVFILNTSRPLFHNNPSLRRAINFAVDRPALQGLLGGRLSGTLTDRYLPPSYAGRQKRHIYPLTHPDVRKAKALARHHLKGGKAVLYIPDAGPLISLAQTLEQDLKKIGLSVEIKVMPFAAYFERVKTRGEPFDIAWENWLPDYSDPSAYINPLLDGRLITARDNTNIAYFNSSRYNRLMAHAARLRGAIRYRAYAKLDADIARNAAPMVAWRFWNELTLVSKRVGCIILRPALDLSAACLK